MEKKTVNGLGIEGMDRQRKKKTTKMGKQNQKELKEKEKELKENVKNTSLNQNQKLWMNGKYLEIILRSTKGL